MGLSSLNIKLIANIEQFSTSMQNAERSLNRVSKKMQSVGRSMTTYITLPIVALSAYSVKAFDEQEKAVAQVDAAIKSTGGAAGYTSEQLTKMASSLQDKSLFGDEEILKSLTANLLTYTKVTGEEFPRAQQAIADYAARTGRDLLGTTTMVGKALNDPIKGLSALGKSGVQFSGEQERLITSFVKIGDTAAAQKIILGELEKQYGGSAEAAAKAGAGPIKQLTMAMGDLSESFGKIILTAIMPLVSGLRNLVKWFSDLSENTKKTILVISGIAAGIGVLLLIMVKAIAVIKAVNTAFLFLSANPIVLIIAAIVAVISLIVIGFIKLSNKVGGVGNAFELMGDTAVAALKTAWEYIKAFGKGVFSIFKNIGKSLLAPFQALALAATGHMAEAKKALVDGLQNPLRDISGIFGEATKNTKGYWKAIGDKSKRMAADARITEKAAEAEKKKAEADKKAIATTTALLPGGKSSKNKTAAPEMELIAPEDLIPAVEEVQPTLDNLLNSLDLETIPLDVELDVEEPELDKITDKYNQVVEKIRQANEEISNLINSAIQNLITSTADMVGSLIADASMTGVDKWKTFFSGILMTVADFGSQLGALLVSIGMSKLVLDTSFISNPALAIAAGVSLIAASAAAKKFISAGMKFEAGGIVPGTSMFGDHIPALVNSGEMILNQSQQSKLFSLANSGGGASVKIYGKISGNDIRLSNLRSTNRYNRI